MLVLGAGALSATALALQDALRAGDPAAWGPLVPRFEADLRTVLQGLAAHFQPPA